MSLYSFQDCLEGFEGLAFCCWRLWDNLCRYEICRLFECGFRRFGFCHGFFYFKMGVSDGHFPVCLLS